MLFNQSEYFSIIPLNLVCFVFILLQFKILLLPCFAWDFFTRGLLGPDKHGRTYSHLWGFLRSCLHSGTLSSWALATPVSLDFPFCVYSGRLLGFAWAILPCAMSWKCFQHLREVLGWRRRNSAGHCTSLTFSTSEAKQKPQKLSSPLPNPHSRKADYLLNLCGFAVSYFWTLIYVVIAA